MPGTFVRGVRVVARGAREEPRPFVWAVGGSVVYGVGTAAGGFLVGRTTDSVVVPALTGSAEVTAGDVWRAGGVLAAVTLLTVVAVLVRRIAAGASMYALQARYRRLLVRRYLDLPLSWHHAHPAGRLLATAGSDVEATWQAMAVLPFTLGVLVMLAVAGAAMVVADPVLAAIGLTVLPVIIGANAVYQRFMSPRVSRVQQLRGEVSGIAHESFEGALVVKTLGRKDQEVTRFGASARRLRDANVAAGRVRGSFEPLIEALPSLGTLAVLAVGTARVASGDVSTGDVVQVAYLLSLMAFPVRAIGWLLAELPRSVAGDERLAEVLKTSQLTDWGPDDLTAAGPAGVRLRGVGYRHAPPVAAEVAPLVRGAVPAARRGDGGDAPDDASGTPVAAVVPALVSVDLDVVAGSTVAVVGSTGAGKSTLAGLLVRLVDPTTGEVLVDGVDTRSLREGALAASAALVPQTTFVFDDTVRGNVAVGLDDPSTPPERRVDDARVWEALRLAQADGFVAALPDGLDTRVGERGSSLSGGQRQRIALARALVRRPRLLVMDDATSALDPAVERAVLDGLRDSGLGTTVVVVAYRPATIALADEVVHLERGRIVDRGPADELAERDSGYRELVTAYARAASDRAAAAAEHGSSGSPESSGSSGSSGSRPAGRRGRA